VVPNRSPGCQPRVLLFSPYTADSIEFLRRPHAVLRVAVGAGRCDPITKSLKTHRLMSGIFAAIRLRV
jgi:hypothetical protein